MANSHSINLLNPGLAFNIDFGISVSSILIDNSTQAQTTENINLIQNYLLVVNNSTQAQTTENINLIQNYVLTIDSITQIQISENIVLSAHYTIILYDSSQTQTGDNIILIYNTQGVVIQMLHYKRLRSK